MRPDYWAGRAFLGQRSNGYASTKLAARAGLVFASDRPHFGASAALKEVNALRGVPLRLAEDLFAPAVGADGVRIGYPTRLVVGAHSAAILDRLHVDASLQHSVGSRVSPSQPILLCGVGGRIPCASDGGVGICRVPSDGYWTRWATSPRSRASKTKPRQSCVGRFGVGPS